MDPQGNATMGCGIDKREVDYSACDVLLGDASAADTIVSAPEGGFAVLPESILSANRRAGHATPKSENRSRSTSTIPASWTG